MKKIVQHEEVKKSSFSFAIDSDILQVHKLLSLLQQKPADVSSKVLGLSGIYLASQRKDSI